jgi:hypothetical protein
LQLARPCLHLLEQARVFNGDDCLVGKSFEQIDLSVGEWADLAASDHNRADGLACVDQRDAERGAMAELERPVPVFIRLGLQVCDVDRSPANHSTA